MKLLEYVGIYGVRSEVDVDSKCASKSLYFAFIGNTCPSPSEVKIGSSQWDRLVPKTSSKLRLVPKL